MATDTDPLLLTHDGFVATITINRAEQHNVWSSAMAPMLEDLVRRCAADDAVRVIVFTGAGSTFCAGADVAALKAAQAADDELPGCIASGDFKEGVRHYLEKRPAQFTGR